MLLMGVLNLYKKIRNKQGFTVIELIVAIAIAGIMIIISINLLGLTNKTHSLSLKEYDLQSSIRRAVEETNQIVRYSKAVFAVPQTFVAGTDKMDPGWNFLMVSPDGKRIVSMEYDASEGKEEFIERVLVPEQKNIRYEIFFEKDSTATADNVMKYVLKAYIVDKKGNKTNEKTVYETTVESINAVQVADKGTGIPKEGVHQGASPSLALAYRSDGQTAGKGRNDIAYITLIVDVSGSMRLLPEDIDANVSVPGKEKDGSRIQKVREALNGTTNDELDETIVQEPKEGIIQKFEKEENIYVSLVPFSTTANYPSPITGTQSSAKHPIYDLYNNKVYSNNDRHKESLRDEIIHKLEAEGGTNTGDGLRRAYHLHKNFRGTMKDVIKDSTQVHHYMILLVDGQTTFEVENGKWEKKTVWNFIFPSTRWVFEPNGQEQKYYLENGNIKSTQSSNQNSDPGINYAITGTGNSFAGTGYVDAIGKELIKEFESEIKSYVIGYATGLTHRVAEIGESIGTEKIYSYDDEDFDLDEVFKNIANDILADFWVVAGPQIQTPQILIN